MSQTVFRPTTLEEAAEFLTRASASRTQVRIGEALDPTALDRILEHEAGDLTCTVEAGARLSTIQAAVGPAGQRLALDPPGDPTIGACIAAALSGPLRHRFGTPRDLVLGMTLVLGDGTITSSGGKVVKNVAGYDLGKLMCGSRGTLALIGRVSLRLHPAPGASETVVVETTDPPSVVAALLGSQLQPSALDVLHPGRVAVLFEGGARSVAAQVDAARSLVGAAPAAASVWDESRARQAAAAGRVRFAPRDLATTLATFDEAVVRPAAGVAYVTESVTPPTSEAAQRVVDALKQALDPDGVLA